MANLWPNRLYKLYIILKVLRLGFEKKMSHGYSFGTFGRDIWAQKNGFALLKLKSLEFLRSYSFLPLRCGKQV